MQYVSHHAGDSGFAIGSGNAYNLQLDCGHAVPERGNYALAPVPSKSEGVPVVNEAF
jgi:hypothetical protein